ncbi:MAG: ATP-binding protein [Candidatus Thorarchaeota archaeon]
MEIIPQGLERFVYLITKNFPTSVITHHSHSILLFFNTEHRKLKGKGLEEIFNIQHRDNYEIASIPSERISSKYNSDTICFILARYPLNFNLEESTEILFLTPYLKEIEKSLSFPEVISLQLFEKTLLSSLGDGIYICDFNDKIIFANQKLCKLRGVQPVDLINSSFISFLVRDSLRIPKFVDSSSSPDGATHIFLGKVNRRDKDIWVEVCNSHLTFQGIPFAIAGIVRDVSKREDLIRELRDQYIISRNITAFISHEIQGALTAIQGFSEYLLLHPESYDNSPKVYNYLEVILSNAKRINNITTDILTTFSLKHFQIEPTLNLSSINCTEIITQCVAELSGLIEAKNIRIRVKTENYASPFIKVDEGKFFRVIINLMENAVKYSPKGSVITVFVSISEDESMVHIRIIDEGIGIQQEDLKEIFTQFHRGKNVGDVKGTGIGLFLSKEYIKQMFGEITIHSDGLGKGTEVLIKVPISKDKQPQPLTESNILI